MALVKYVSHDGIETEVKVAAGTSIMQAAINHGLNGIVGECSGSAMCATCHVYLTDEDINKFPPASAVEQELLECTASPRRPNSRLSCQLVPSDGDDLTVTVHIPQMQQ